MSSQPDIDPDADVEVRLYCRASTTTASAIDRYHSELTRLVNADVVEDVDVVTWPTRVELSAGAESEVAEAYDRFTEWADREGYRLAPAFDVETYESEFTGESGTALVTPVASIAVREDGDLSAVYPHVEEGDVVSVEDGLERLRDLAGATATGTGPARASRTQD